MSQPHATAGHTRRVSRLGFGTARLDEYLGYWAIAPEHGQALADQARRMNVRVHVLAQEAGAEADAEWAAAQQPEPKAASRFGDDYGERLMDDGTALIRVEGTLMKFAGSMSRGTGTVALRRQVRRAKSDDGVKRVLLTIDSPGGTVAGTQELADDVAELAAAKPTHIFVEDLMASAALWVGVQGATVSANATALVGSIGTYMAVADYSGLAKREGVKVHLVTTGKYKGAGTPGVKVTPEQVAEWQRVVDGLNEHFLNAVAAGRGLSIAKVKELADGRVHLAADAKRLGLIDHVEGLDAALDRVRSAPAGGKKRKTMRADAPAETPTATADAPDDTPDAGGRSAGTDPPAQDAGSPAEPPAEQQQEIPMKDQQQQAPAGSSAATEPKPATIAELKAAFPDDAAFALDAAEKAYTLTEAKAAYADVLQGKLNAAGEENAKLKAAAAEKQKADEKQAADAAAAAAEAGDKRPGVPAAAAAAAAAEQKDGKGNVTATAAAESSGDAVKDQAKADWAANVDDCRDKFMGEKAYVGYRVASAKGRVRAPAKRED